MDTLIRVLAPILEVLFFGGIMGSAVVIILTSIEDVETMLEKDEIRRPADHEIGVP